MVKLVVNKLRNVTQQNLRIKIEPMQRQRDSKPCWKLKLKLLSNSRAATYTQEEAQDFEPFEPLKAQPFTDFAHRVKFPCVAQAKFNGQRLMIDKNGNAWSKQGEPLELPAHWNGVRELAIQMQGLDGEIYAGLESEGGLSLQDIISAFRKSNANTPKLQYWVYDIPLKGVTFRERFDKLHNLGWLWCSRKPFLMFE